MSERLKLREKNRKSQRCPLCREDLGQERLFKCEHDNITYHRECLREMGRCSCLTLISIEIARQQVRDYAYPDIPVTRDPGNDASVIVFLITLLALAWAGGFVTAMFIIILVAFCIVVGVNT